MKKSLLAVAATVVVLGLVLPTNAMAAFDVPAGFSDDLVVEGLNSPTAIDWLPGSENGDLLIATQNGNVFRWDGTGTSADEVLDLTSTVCSGGETGLLGLAVDPDFQSGDRFIYLYYTDRRPNGSCGQAKGRANRVSRFTMNGSDQLVNEQVLIDKIPAPGGNHNGGDLQFDNDKLLYISVGDGGKDLKTGLTQDDNENARRFTHLNGKILRITRDGGIPSGNPYQGKRSKSCAENGGIGAKLQIAKNDKGKKAAAAAKKKGKKPNRCQEIFARGLRNPFRIAFDPDDNSGQQRFFINDVGGDGFEEINEGRVRGDYGWNEREGPCPINQISNNCSPSNKFDEPDFSYRRDGASGPNVFEGCRTITGGAFVPQSADWPGSLPGVYLFTDIQCGKIFELRNETSGEAPDVFADNGSASHFKFGPEGELFYTDIFAGEVRKITPPVP